MRLLDSMLAKMASELPEALFFFDSENRCIWANSPGIALIGAEDDNYDLVPDRLRALFGDGGQDKSGQREVTIGGAARSFVLESHNVTDDRGRAVGSFLSVRENTIEQETLQREMYKATHDSLTSLYNRAGYDLLMSRLELKSTYLLLIDADNFKTVNDTYGHDMGDRILQKIANTIKHNFRAEDCICRIGGDEFVVFINHAGTQQKQLIVSRISRINGELSDTGDGLPSVSVSVGIAHGGGMKDPAKLFEHADHALYETKRRGKQGYTFYENGQYTM